MPIRRWLVPATLALLLTATTAQACMMASERELSDIALADAVVIARLTDYEIVRDEAFRRAQLANPNLSDDLREIYSDPGQGLLSDYARFTLEVQDVLKGEPPARFAVTWDNSTFAEPETMAPGLYLVAVRDPAAPLPPLRGPSATILPNPEPATMTLLQAPCAPPFLFPLESAPLDEVRALLRGG
ncbi:hypothetical protein [Aurantiacibacter poecillastricola]|uniref:hypothetical protein n=1 Tax=Aurantiacibacter poecillastricola TaxID=3064385 RepID=UPI00273EEF0A|nr:hypothetical protein [Aurantiacibacter sp. 219JJ12-13]MDP5260561.1 hypothetical protein [Aurantiacibacter sp. 219JJ12-13]